MRPGGTNLRILWDLRSCSQAPHPYDAYLPQIVISDPDNRSIDLDVAPLLDVVRIHEEVD